MAPGTSLGPSNESHSTFLRRILDEVNGIVPPNITRPAPVTRTAQNSQLSRRRQPSSSQVNAASTTRDARARLSAADEVQRDRTNNDVPRGGASTQHTTASHVRSLPSPPGANGHTSGQNGSAALESNITARTTQGIRNPVLGQVPSRPTLGGSHGPRIPSRGRPLLSRNRTARTGSPSNVDDTVSELSTNFVPTEAPSSPASRCSTEATTVSDEHVSTSIPQTNNRRKRFRQVAGPSSPPRRRVRAKKSPELDLDWSNTVEMFDAEPEDTYSESHCAAVRPQPFFDSDSESSDL